MDNDAIRKGVRELADKHGKGESFGDFEDVVRDELKQILMTIESEKPKDDGVKAKL